MPRSRTFPQVNERAPLLERLRTLKMARSAHAYVRGNTVQFYDWLEKSDAALPQGPQVWICGDCHVSNIGPIAGADGQVDLQIRDLDQTVIGNPAHDMIRLGVSLAMAARGSDLPGVVTAQMMEQLVLGYESALKRRSGKGDPLDQRPDSIRIVMRRAVRRKWKHLANDRIEGVSPDIPLSRKFWPISQDERDELRKLVASEAMRKLATTLKSRDDDDEIEMLDAAYWVKGCSSLGGLRYAVLVRVGKSGDPESSLCLLDIKQTHTAAAPRAKAGEMPGNSAKRVVEGAVHLAPNLGHRMLAATIQGKPVFVRELLPQDLKIDLEHLEAAEAMNVAFYLGMIVGRAHASQMKPADRKLWLRQLQRNRPQDIDTPSWLWKSVVELVQAHEGGYLDHCRRFANSASAAQSPRRMRSKTRRVAG